MVIHLSKLPKDRRKLAGLIRKACDDYWYTYQAPSLPPIDLEREQARLWNRLTDQVEVE